jgi:hypothetical protein
LSFEGQGLRKGKHDKVLQLDEVFLQSLIARRWVWMTVLPEVIFAAADLQIAIPLVIEIFEKARV